MIISFHDGRPVAFASLVLGSFALGFAVTFFAVGAFFTTGFLVVAARGARADDSGAVAGGASDMLIIIRGWYMS